MYGMHVHESVIRNKEKESGITVHFVNEEYDEGKTILQAKCHVEDVDAQITGTKNSRIGIRIFSKSD